MSTSDEWTRVSNKYGDVEFQRPVTDNWVASLLNLDSGQWVISLNERDDSPEGMSARAMTCAGYGTPPPFERADELVDGLAQLVGGKARMCTPEESKAAGTPNLHVTRFPSRKKK